MTVDTSRQSTAGSVQKFGAEDSGGDSGLAWPLVLGMAGHADQGTAMDPKALFLARMQSDSGLQRLIRDPAIASAAVSIARAAGFVVTPEEIAGSANPGRSARSEWMSADPDLGAAAADGDLIDFDGDGIPDAVRRGDRWELTAQDDG